MSGGKKLGEALEKIDAASRRKNMQSLASTSRDDVGTRVQMHNFSICMTALRSAAYGGNQKNVLERYDAFMNYLDALTHHVEIKILNANGSDDALSPAIKGKIRSNLAKSAVLSGLQGGISPERYAERIYNHPFMKEDRAEWTKDSTPNEEESDLLTAVNSQMRIHRELISVLDITEAASDKNLKVLALGKNNTSDGVAVGIYKIASDASRSLLQHMQHNTTEGHSYGQLAHSSVKSSMVTSAVHRLRHGATNLQEYIVSEWDKNPISQTKMMESGVILPWMKRELDHSCAAIITTLDGDPRILTSKTYFRDSDAVSHDELKEMQSSIDIFNGITTRRTESAAKTDEPESIGAQVAASEISINDMIKQASKPKAG